VEFSIFGGSSRRQSLDDYVRTILVHDTLLVAS
jgi:hypothetical protein